MTIRRYVIALWPLVNILFNLYAAEVPNPGVGAFTDAGIQTNFAGASRFNRSAS